MMTVIIVSNMEDVSNVLKQARYDIAANMQKLSEQGLLITVPISDLHVPTEQPEVVSEAI